MFTQKRSIYLNINTKKSTKSSKRSLKLQDEQQKKKIEYFYRKTETYFYKRIKNSHHPKKLLSFEFY